MAPKKNVATASHPVTKQPAKPKEKKVPSKDVVADGEKKPRVMSACSTEFVASVQAGLPEEISQKLKAKEIKEICETFVRTLVSSVIEGKSVNFTNNMSFARKVRAARVYKNLKTKESITKPKHYVMTMAIKPSLRKQFDDISVTESGGDVTVNSTE